MERAEIAASPPGARDERGAVLVIGLFLALAAIAALWCVIGIGDAIVARERSQEAADSVAYASAVVQARGMNFISMLNLIGLAGCLLYIVLTLLDMVLSVLISIVGVNTFFSLNTCYVRYATWLVRLDVPWCKISKGLEAVEGPLYKIDQTYFENYKKVATRLFKLQTFAASSVPYIGAIASVEASIEYDHLGIAYSHSLMPGGGARWNLVRPLMNRIPFTVHNLNRDDEEELNLFQDRRIGLPVESEQAYNYCIRGPRFVFEVTKDAALSSDFGILPHPVGYYTQYEEVSMALYGIFQLTGENVRAYYCAPPSDDAMNRFPADGLQRRIQYEWFKNFGLHNIRAKTDKKFYLQTDPFWQEYDDPGRNYPSLAARPNRYRDSGYYRGPKRMTAYAYNGSDWMQSWAFVTPIQVEDKAYGAVLMPARVFGRPTPEPERPAWYEPIFVAEAEFYYDCPASWTSSRCNKGNAAIYQMKWRARLRRWHSGLNLNTPIEMLLDNALMSTLFKNGFKSLGEKYPSLTLARKEALVKTIRFGLAKVINHRILIDDQTYPERLH